MGYVLPVIVGENPMSPFERIIAQLEDEEARSRGECNKIARQIEGLEKQINDLNGRKFKMENSCDENNNSKIKVEQAFQRLNEELELKKLALQDKEIQAIKLDAQNLSNETQIKHMQTELEKQAKEEADNRMRKEEEAKFKQEEKELTQTNDLLHTEMCELQIQIQLSQGREASKQQGRTKLEYSTCVIS